MRLVMAMAPVICAIVCAPACGEAPRASLSVGDALRVECGPGNTSAEFRSVSAVGVKELRLELLRIDEGVSSDLWKGSFPRSKGGGAGAADRGQLVLLLRREGGLVIPSAGLKFNGTGLSPRPIASGMRSKIRTGARSAELRRPAGEVPAGRRVVLYALVE